MCTSKAQGGKRCFFHASKTYKGAVATVAALSDAASDKEVSKAQVRYEEAVASLAAEPTGMLHLRKRAAAIEAGDTLGGDDLAVLRKYAPPEVPSATTVALQRAFRTREATREDRPAKPREQLAPVLRTEGKYAATLEEAFRYNKPMAPERRVTKTVAPPSAFADTSLAASLRGDTSPFGGEVVVLPGGLDENGPALLGSPKIVSTKVDF